MRVAAIDVGSNTVLLLVAEVGPSGVLAPLPLLERASITRLGAGVDRERRLAADAVARTVACLEDYAQLAAAFRVERFDVVGTSALRDTGGSSALSARVRDLFGVELRVLTGAEEARVTFEGALSGLSLPADVETSVFDIGGGSTEVVLGRGGRAPEYARSFDLGSVRLTERHVRHDPPTTEELAAIERDVAAELPSVPPQRGSGPPIGVAGTVTTLAAVEQAIVPYDGARVHGTVITFDRLRSTVDRLARIDAASRRLVPGIEPKRADVIVAGGLIAIGLLRHWSAGAVRVSDRGLRWGVAQALATH